VDLVFDTQGYATEPLLGTAPPQPLAHSTHAARATFATGGACSWPEDDLGRRATMRFDTTSEVVDDPRPPEQGLWAGVRKLL